MRKIFFTGIVLGALLIPVVTLFAQSNNTESLTISTYYPAPYGVYRNVRLVPSAQPAAGSTLEQPGSMYFDGTELRVYYNTTVDWKGVSGGLWTQDGANINYDSGNVGIGTAFPSAKLDVNGSISGNVDVCSGSICLSQIPLFFSPNPLYAKIRTIGDCNSAGGSVIRDPDGGSLPVCLFINYGGVSCPSGWLQYKNWMETVTASQSLPACSYGCCAGAPSSGTNPGHSWSNNDERYPLHGTICGAFDGCGWNPSCGCCAANWYGKKVKVACY